MASFPLSQYRYISTTQRSNFLQIMILSQTSHCSIMCHDIDYRSHSVKNRILFNAHKS